MTNESTPAESDSGPTFRLIYRSHSLIESDKRATELGSILTTARRANRSRGVTGALMVDNDGFVQALEGDEVVVRELYAKIAQDPRHTHCAVLDQQVIDGRVFGRWAMAEVVADGPDVRLLSNARYGRIVSAPGQDRSITPAQETVLAYMRTALRTPEPSEL